MSEKGPMISDLFLNKMTLEYMEKVLTFLEKRYAEWEKNQQMNLRWLNQNITDLESIFKLDEQVNLCETRLAETQLLIDQVREFYEKKKNEQNS